MSVILLTTLIKGSVGMHSLLEELCTVLDVPPYSTYSPPMSLQSHFPTIVMSDFT